MLESDSLKKCDIVTSTTYTWNARGIHVVYLHAWMFLLCYAFFSYSWSNYFMVLFLSPPYIVDLTCSLAFVLYLCYNYIRWPHDYDINDIREREREMWMTAAWVASHATQEKRKLLRTCLLFPFQLRSQYTLLVQMVIIYIPAYHSIK